MKLWIDAQLSPALSLWITENFPVQAIALRELGLRDASDREIFDAAQQAGAIVLTKDSDFVELVLRLGSPPQIIWLTCGNTSNERLKEILLATLSQAIALIKAGEALVEIE
jgi:predicted nuclease of predicted toxin-antitoxin system